ncbi:MAG: hypothetical protein KatS3mg113_0862 [Planctomycetaceae bacterium]|nr:MAG: hypothetical protein KatS3mg113_0862 [Planctomycetaceae bacterium]
MASSGYEYDEANVHVVIAPAEPFEVQVSGANDDRDVCVVQAGDSRTRSEHLVVAQTSLGGSQLINESASGGLGVKDPVKLPGGFSPLSEYGFSPDGWPLRIVCEKNGSVMALIPAGPTLVGSRHGPPECQPEWSITLEHYYMDITEVTVGDYLAYRQSQRESKKRVPQPPLNESAPADYPVLGVTWMDAQAYLEWLGKDLPTEVEYEKAARGPDGWSAPWGNGPPSWKQPRDLQTITEVAFFPTDCSIYGIFDLAGNAREWVADFYSPTAHQEAAVMTQTRHLPQWSGPKKPHQGLQRVVKGNGPGWHAWFRQGYEMAGRHPDVGFRGVLRLSTSQ